MRIIPNRIEMIMPKPIPFLGTTAIFLFAFSNAPNLQGVEQSGGEKSQEARSPIQEGRSIRTTFIEPFEVSVVAAGEPGVVSDVCVREGDMVKQGERLGGLDLRVHSEVLKAAQVRASSKAKVEASRAALAIQNLRRQNFEELAGSGHANKAELDKIQLEHAAAQSALELAIDESELAKIEVQRIQAQIDLRQVTAPLGGVVSTIHRQVGEYLPANDPKFATVVRLDLLKAKFFIDAPELGRWNSGEQVPIYLVQSNQLLTARVHFISPLVDPDSGTTRVEVSIINADFKLRSGSVCFLGTREEYAMLHGTSKPIPAQIAGRSSEVTK